MNAYNKTNKTHEFLTIKKSRFKLKQSKQIIVGF